MKKESKTNYGIVYALTNPAMPGLVKIGMSTRKDVGTRMRELYTTGVPVPFVCAYACMVKLSDCKKVEKILHTAFEPNRINPKREFFSIQTKQAIAILEYIDEKDNIPAKEITKEVNDTIRKETTSVEIEAGERLKRLPNLNFREMGIPMESVLRFTKDPKIKIKVINDRKVWYDNKEWYLSGLTKKLLNTRHNTKTCLYWNFDGKNLEDIYVKTYSKKE